MPAARRAPKCPSRGHPLTAKEKPMRLNVLPALLTAAALAAAATAADKTGAAREDRSWVEAMKQVHARFKGTPGTFAHFGDSITVTMAFWAPLRGEPKGMSP